MQFNYCNYLIVLLLFYHIAKNLTNADKIFVHVPQIRLPNYCNSRIYCDSDLLHTIQMADIFKDSKSFVDLAQKYEEDVTLNNFNNLINQTTHCPTRADVRKFVEEQFSDVDELENVDLVDWHENPLILNKIKDHHYKNWAKELNKSWITLARRIRDDVQRNPKRYSIIYVNNTFIVPGGRFREFYYWDSYWIINGLLISGLRETAKGMIQNFLFMVDNYGFVPNGGRVYYLMRSQPPLLSQMVYKYYKVTGDLDFTLSALPRLEKEFKYWHENKTVLVKKNNMDAFLMARYVVTSSDPRPESYREDYEAYEALKGNKRQRYFYENIKAGAETGWDFSARWFENDGKVSTDLLKMSTTMIIPVDLNAFIEKNARILAKLNHIAGNLDKARYYEKIALQYREAIKTILWNETDGTWYDFNMLNKKQNTRFYASNLTPLYTRSYDPNQSAKYGQRAVKYLKRMKAIKIGGIPSSLDITGQQWDFPNGWAPTMSMVVQGLRNTDYVPAKYLAERLATLWLGSNYRGFLTNNRSMYEKYDVENLGCSGGGGEYEPQTGFGWTNGVALEFLEMYPQATYNETINIMNKECSKRKKIRRLL